MDKALVEVLVEARDSLTPDNWRKCSYFQVEKETLCMCAHGAVQALVNPQVKKALESSVLPECAAAVALSIVTVGARRRATRGGAAAGFGSAGTWHKRPSWVKTAYHYNGLNYGTLDAHYLLGMVGLTVSYNDHKDTTLEMIIAKFNEAIELAKQLTL